MKLLRETTEWDMPSHTYLVNNQGHLIAYQKFNKGDFIYFNNPLKKFSTSRRKFIKKNVPINKNTNKDLVEISMVM